MKGFLKMTIKLLGHAKFILIVGINLAECVSIFIETIRLILNDIDDF